MRYDPSVIEPRWQKAWAEQRVFEVPRDVKALEGKPKYYILDMFPYPSGAGLHVGHPEGYTATDILARMKRMRGYNVLHPMGWDAFGLPAERSAVRENIHPAVITKRNIENFRGQLQRIGFSYDWSREVSTTDEKYYRWTQWIFLKLYEKGLAYMAEVPVNWCPALGTVLANEEVKDGKYVETGDPVERRLMKQWMLKITAYGDRLLEDLDGLDWPESIKEMQRNWIGKSEGAEVRFDVDGADEHGAQEHFIVFTTRPDTLFGATYCVLAPEHPLVAKVTTAEQKAAVDAYVAEAKNKSDLARTDLAKDKTGVFTGAYAVNPVNGAKVPIWVADYVLITYGTGAIMAVPGHDERDHAFAKKLGLPIVEVVKGSSKPIEDEAYTGDGTLVNSPLIDGLSVPDAKKKITAWLEEQKKGERKVQYRLRDWLFSRQRYWGEPFPVLHAEDGEVLTVPEGELPVVLPPVDEYKPTEDGRPPLARAPKEWIEVTLPDGRKAWRETNTMPQWAGSCWYYLRFIDPGNDEEPWDKAAEKYWMPVDLYVGGVEHAVLHLLYARFWHKVLYDCGLVSTKEPFQRLFNQGMILGFSYQDADGRYYHRDDILEHDGKLIAKSTKKAVTSQIEKMSKSKLNVENPDDVIRDYGADALRLYEMFMGPLDQVKPWQMAGVEGVYRFLARVWRLIVDEESDAVNAKVTDAPPGSEPELQRALHKTIKKVLHDSEGMHFNTAISQMMTFVNDATSAKTLPRAIAKDFLKVLSPYAPHIAEELWHRLGEQDLIARAAWPAHDDALCVENTVKLAVQVNGKRRDEIEVAREASKEDVEQAALASELVQRHLEGKAPKKVIVVPGRLVNIVA